MEVVKLTKEELWKLPVLAEEFYNSSSHLRGFKAEVAVTNWQKLIESDMGVVFGLKDGEDIIGMLGAMKIPDLHTGERLGIEIFWFVSESRRSKGLLLVKAFEGWGKENRCSRLIMAYMQDLMPEKLEKLYEKLGYTLMEKSYVKEI